MRYPEDEICVIDSTTVSIILLIKAFGGQALNISTNTDTHINPFDSSLQYAKNDKEAIKEKSEIYTCLL